MDSLRENFLSEVEAFLSATGMDKTTFGKGALGDGRFVTDLRSTDRAPSTRTIAKARQFMRDHAAKKRLEAAQVEEIISGDSPRAA